MMELKEREEIIKALECCSVWENCDGCTYRNSVALGCTSKMMRAALSLIKELTEENEQLNKLLEHCEDDGEYWEGKYNNAVADTVRKMQEKIKEKLDISVCGYSTEEVVSDVFDTIDQIAKEMLEKNK